MSIGSESYCRHSLLSLVHDSRRVPDRHRDNYRAGTRSLRRIKHCMYSHFEVNHFLNSSSRIVRQTPTFNNHIRYTTTISMTSFQTFTKSSKLVRGGGFERRSFSGQLGVSASEVGFEVSTAARSEQRVSSRHPTWGFGYFCANLTVNETCWVLYTKAAAAAWLSELLSVERIVFVRTWLEAIVRHDKGFLISRAPHQIFGIW